MNKIDKRFLYLCDFDLSRSSGKDRATRQKLDALKPKVAELDIVNNIHSYPFLRFLSIIFLDIKSSYILLSKRPNFFISRGYAGALTIFFAKMLGITSAREVHANAIEEAALLPYSGIKLSVIKLMGSWAHMLDCWSDVRIFNHPDLLSYYKHKGWSKNEDFFAYNGYDPLSKCMLNKENARKKFGLNKNAKIVVFIGAASKWHGVEYLVDLQKVFDKNSDGIQVVFGGGGISAFDLEKRCLNFSPLDDKGCAELVRAADLCALSVKNNRVSPGSPLKLYDYIVNERFVLAQSDTNGYSDEVTALGVGVAVDFTSPEDARLTVLEAFDEFCTLEYPRCSVSWSDRMDVWLSNLKSSKKN